MRRRLLPLLCLLLTAPLAASRLTAAGLPCEPCAGVRLGDPTQATEAVTALRAQNGLEPGSPLVIAWEVELAPAAGGQGTVTPPGPVDPAALAGEIARAGGTPWLSLIFHTPAPLATNAVRLQGELQAAAAIAARVPAGTFFQVVWRPEASQGGAQDGDRSPSEYAFLLKRAAVALTGARPDGLVATEPLPAEAAAVEALYAQDVAAYLEAVALTPGSPQDVAATAAAIEAVGRLDPGRAVVVDSIPLPAEREDVLAEAARWAVAGADLTLFAAPPGAAVTAANLAPFALLAREFAGDISYDPNSAPTGAAEAWSFVRGKDLALRVIAVIPPGREAALVTLLFPDSSLRRPTRFPLTAGSVPPPAGRVTPGGVEIQLGVPGRVAVLGIERQTAEEREGVAERVTVAGEREIPVEEILRRLQAFEDAQARRLQHYQAINTTHLRFQVGASAQSFEATLRGPFFSAGQDTDWAWQELFVNGVRWRSKTIPEIPLVQPEKAAALPLEITFTREYRYRLRGREQVDGRDAWVIDFAPAVDTAAAAGKLYQGSVWVDRATYARVKTRAVQLGLEGEVISNEETLFYRPIDATGSSTPWTAASSSFVLPLRRVSQQILSVVNAATVVERETLLSDVRINGAGFAAARDQVAASDVTMVRDTERGLRYLVKDESGRRAVKEGFDSDKFFLGGGVFYDDALDYPLPLAGLNYFSFDFRGSGKQVNVFFAGALLTANVAEPRLFGSRFDLGAQVFGIAVPLTDTLFRDEVEVTAEEVEVRPATFSLKLGRPLGNFLKLNLEYGLLYSKYEATDNTASDFVLPESNLLHSASGGLRFARSGYQASANASFNRRSKWDFWGLPGPPGTTDFDPDAQEFLRWDAAVSKNWYLPLFQKIGLELAYASGSDLDRFSKYEFGFFGSTRVHGYQSNRVRASEAFAGHLTYGFEIGQALRLDAIADVAIATDEATGLDNERLAGLGIAGTFIGPWQTVVNVDLGVPVAGPDDGFVAYLVFLKLFR